MVEMKSLTLLCSILGNLCHDLSAYIIKILVIYHLLFYHTSKMDQPTIFVSNPMSTAGFCMYSSFLLFITASFLSQSAFILCFEQYTYDILHHDFKTTSFLFCL